MIDIAAIRETEICEVCEKWLRDSVARGKVKSAWDSGFWDDGPYLSVLLTKWQKETKCIEGCVRKVMSAAKPATTPGESGASRESQADRQPSPAPSQSQQTADPTTPSTPQLDDATAGGEAG